MSQHLHHRFSRAVSFILLLISLTGCALSPYYPATRPDHTSTVEEVAQEDKRYAPLQPQTTFDLLTAELAGHRKRYDIALGHYVKQAHETRDVGVIQRAYQIAVYMEARQAALDMALLDLEVQPTSPATLHNAALELTHAGQTERAFELMQKQLKLGGTPAFDLLANALSSKLTEQQVEPWLAKYQTLHRRYKKNKEITLGYAQLLHKSGEAGSALGITTRLLEQHQNWMPAAVLRAKLLIALQQFGEAEVLLESLAAQFPQRMQVQLLYLRVLMAQENMVTLEEQLALLESRHSKDSVMMFSIALLALDNNYPQISQRFLEQQIQRGQRVNSANFYLGMVHKQLGNTEKAIQHWRKVKSGREFLPAVAELSKQWLKKSDVRTVRRYFKQAHNRQPQHSEPLFLMEGNLLLETGHPELALTLMNEALDKHPESIDLLFTRAMVFDGLGNFNKLEVDLNNALQIDPNNVLVLNAMGYILLERVHNTALLEDYEEAESFIASAYALAPNNPAVMDSMGWLHYRLGRLESALPLLQGAYEQTPHPDIAAHLGEVLWVMGDMEQAVTVWQAALENAPDNKAILDTMQRLAGQ